MNSAKKYLHKLIEEVPETEYLEIIDFLEFIKSKHKAKEFSFLEEASQSSTEFWENDIDDEVWNNV